MTAAVKNPFVFGRSIELHEPFFNRGHETAWLLHAAQRRRGEHPLLLFGAPGTGKTSIIKRLEEHSEAENLAAILIDSRQVFELELRNSLYDFSRIIAQQCLKHGIELPKLQKRKLVTNPEEEFIKTFWLPLTQNFKERRLLLAFDNAESLLLEPQAKPQERRLLDIIHSLYQSFADIQFMYIFSEQEFIKPTIIGFTPDKSGILELANFDLEEALNIIDQLHPFRVANDVRKYIHDLTGGHPNDLQRLCHFLYDRCRRLGLKHITMADIAVVIYTDPYPGDYYMPVHKRRNIYKYQFPGKPELIS